MAIITSKKRGDRSRIGHMTRAQLQQMIDSSAGSVGSDGQDTFTIWATSGGIIMATTVNSSGAVTNNASDFISIKGLRANTTIVNNGNTAGVEGTTDDHFALDVETNDKVTGHSYDTSGNERDVHSTWNGSGYIELRDNSTGGAIIAKLTPSDTGNDAKLLLTDFATDQRGASSNILQKIVVDVPVDVRVNGASVTGYPITLTITKNIPGANGTNGSDGSDGSDGAAGAAASSYVSVSGSVASSLISGRSVGHWVPSNGSAAPADGWNITSGLIIGRDNDDAGSMTSPLTLDHTVGEPKETLIAVVPSGETWRFKRLSGIITTTTTGAATPAIEGRLALYETDRPISSMSASEDVVLMDNYASLDIDHSGAGTVVTSFSVALEETVAAGYGILPVLHVEGIDANASAVTFTWTLEFVKS